MSSRYFFHEGLVFLYPPLLHKSGSRKCLDRKAFFSKTIRWNDFFWRHFVLHLKFNFSSSTLKQICVVFLNSFSQLWTPFTLTAAQCAFPYKNFTLNNLTDKSTKWNDLHEGCQLFKKQCQKWEIGCNSTCLLGGHWHKQHQLVLINIQCLYMNCGKQQTLLLCNQMCKDAKDSSAKMQRISPILLTFLVVQPTILYVGEQYNSFHVIFSSHLFSIIVSFAGGDQVF